MKTINQQLETMNHWLQEISKHNNKTIKVTDNLRMVLLNLKILNAKDNILGINVVVDEIERNIKELHDSTQNMVTEGRKELRESYNEIKIYIDKNE